MDHGDGPGPEFQTASSHPSAAIAPPMQPVTSIVPAKAGPVTESERIVTLDVLRGFALFGILMVNMAFFSMPFMLIFADPNLAHTPASEQIAWAVVRTFFEFKFISIFSLLFGIGLVVQMNRAKAAGRPFVATYLRRLAVLFVFGVVHATLIWHGDILFVYAIAGVALLIVSPLSAKTLLAASAFVMGFALVLVFGFGLLQMLGARSGQQAQADHPETVASFASTTPAATGGQQPDPATSNPVPSTEPATTNPTSDFIDIAPPRGFEAIKAAQGDPSRPVWIDGEIAAFKRGPFADAIVFRIVLWAYCLAAAALTFGWHVLAMFFFGAALMKFDFFSPTKARWHLGLALVGLAFGIPIDVMSTWIVHASHHDFTSMSSVYASVLHELGAVLLCIGYVGTICSIVSTGALRWLTYPLSQVGRMALTNYLLQSTIVTGLMYWWGLGWFNDVTRPQQIVIAVAVFAVQLVLSPLWLRYFQFGPAEWLWRTLTYLKPQPMLRRPASAGTVQMQAG